MSSFKAGKTINSPMPGMQSTVKAGHPAAKDSAGVGSGLSSCKPLNDASNAPMQDAKRNPLTGNATERIEPRKFDRASKGGKSFQIES